MKQKPIQKASELSALGYPAFIWFVLFIACPLVVVFVLSFFSRGLYGGVEYILTLSNYTRVMEPVYFLILVRSLKLALITAIACMVIAYPVAWAMSSMTAKWRDRILILLAIPFFTNLIIRVYAIKLFVGMDGPLQSALQFFGFDIDPFVFTQNRVLVYYGLITTYLPFMIFPLYAAFEKFDFSLIEAAQDLGASTWAIILKVVVPQTKVAALSGFILVLIPCMGDFVIPDLLGGAKSMLIGNLITEQYLKARDWTFGSALSVALMCILIFIPLVLNKIVSRKRGMHV